MVKLSKGVLAAAAFAAAVMLPSVGSAATITILNDTDITAVPTPQSANSLGQRGFVTCDACAVLFYTAGAYGFGSPGELFGGPSSSGDAAEAGWVNGVLGTSFTATDVLATKSNGSNGISYTLSTLYAILKIGNEPDYTIIKNLGTAALTFSFAQADGAKGGLSHYFGLGQLPPAPVPLPASALLLAGAIGGLGLTRRRRRAA